MTAMLKPAKRIIYRIIYRISRDGYRAFCITVLLSLIIIVSLATLAYTQTARSQQSTTSTNSLSGNQTSTQTNQMMPIATSQSVVLGFVGQQAIAHAAVIFATLTAAFAFATGFKQKKSRRAMWLYVLLLALLLSGSIYALIRGYYYGELSNTVLNGPASQDQQLCTQVNTLQSYWAYVVCLTTRTNALVGGLALGTLIPSYSISWALGFLSALAVASYFGGNVSDVDTAFGRLPWPFKVAFWAALIVYLLEIFVPMTVAELTIAILGNITINEPSHLIEWATAFAILGLPAGFAYVFVKHISKPFAQLTPTTLRRVFGVLLVCTVLRVILFVFLHL